MAQEVAVSGMKGEGLPEQRSGRVVTVVLPHERGELLEVGELLRMFADEVAEFLFLGSIDSLDGS
jgi:hypothetical protein